MTALFQTFIIGNWQWLVAGGVALIAGFFQLRLHVHQTKESQLKIKELESKLTDSALKSPTLVAAGLKETDVRSSFHGYDYTELIQSSERLTVILNDGRSWIDSNRELLRERLSTRGRVTRFCLVAPDSPYLDLLVKKNGKARAAQVDELRRSVSVIREIAPEWSDLEVLGHSRPTPYCMYLTEAVAIVDPYFYFEAGALPMMIFRSGTPLYAAYSEDARKLLKESKALDSSAFRTPTPGA